MLADFGELDESRFRHQFGGYALWEWDTYWHVAITEALRAKYPKIYCEFETLVDATRSAKRPVGAAPPR